MQIKVTTTTGEHLVPFDSVADTVSIAGPEYNAAFAEVTGLEVVADPPEPEPVDLFEASGGERPVEEKPVEEKPSLIERIESSLHHGDAAA